MWRDVLLKFNSENAQKCLKPDWSVVEFYYFTYTVEQVSVLVVIKAQVVIIITTIRVFIKKTSLSVYFNIRLLAFQFLESLFFSLPRSERNRKIVFLDTLCF